MVEGVAQHLDDDEQEEHGDRGGCHGLVFPVPVRMIRIRRLARGLHADETGHIRGRVGQ